MNQSARRPQHKPSKTIKKKRKAILKEDTLQHEQPPSKRIKTQNKASHLKNHENDNVNDATDEEDAKLWSHFDDWDWDFILQHIS